MEIVTLNSRISLISNRNKYSENTESYATEIFESDISFSFRVINKKSRNTEKFFQTFK